jgi:hypothetical protein
MGKNERERIDDLLNRFIRQDGVPQKETYLKQFL